MKKLFSSMVMAFGMYSKIPTPHISWEKEHMRNMMACFPWVGAAVGLAFAAWGHFGRLLPIEHLLYTVVWLLIPVLLTGGIHMDGFMDTSDALSSYQPMERRLEILKDSHAGAFAILTCVCYFICYFGLLSELSLEYVNVTSLGFFLSRSLSGLAVTTFPCAKNSGLAATFSQNAEKKCTICLLGIELFVCAAGMLFLKPLAGFFQLVIAGLCYWYYHHMALKKFGGVTGDLAGWFLQVCELCMLAGVVAAQTMGKIW